MKKNLEKKLVLKKLIVASLNAKQLEAVRGGTGLEPSQRMGCPTAKCDFKTATVDFFGYVCEG
jgi:hypothetical protein